MSRIKIYGMLILLSLGLFACTDDDNIDITGNKSVLCFDFPQGDQPWDKEIEQIAKDWGMYIIYKGVDSVCLNKVWTNPMPSAAIFTCTEPSGEQVRQYLAVVSKYMLDMMDKTNPDDFKKLPLYLYIVNDFKNMNPKSQDFGKHTRFYQDGLDYWALSMTSEAWDADTTDKDFRLFACMYVYQRIKEGFQTGKYEVPADFTAMTDYEYPVSVRVMSYEDFLVEYKDMLQFMPKEVWPSMYNGLVEPFNRDFEHLYYRHGFAPQVEEADFSLSRRMNGVPFWMPWFQDRGGAEHAMQPLEKRPELDFLNMIRWAMICTPEEMLEKYPVDVPDDAVLAESNRVINAKLKFVIDYMKSKGIDLYIKL